MFICTLKNVGRAVTIRSLIHRISSPPLARALIHPGTIQSVVPSFHRNHSQKQYESINGNSPQFPILRTVSIALGCIAAGVLGTIVYSFSSFRNNTSLSFTVLAAEKPNNTNEGWMSRNFIADVVEKASPAVVYIEIQGRHPFTGKMVPISNGSGFIVRPDGLILTNAHVVANSSTVLVRLNDGRTLTGTVQAVDAVSDLATVKVPGSNLPTLRMAKSSLVRTGEFVVAMGSPFQLSNTVTAGIVSSAQRKSKELGLHNTDINYIQTDANINFGNSGGPLVNLDGDAIGINTMMVTTGISFAIPSDYAQTFLDKAEKIESRAGSRKWFSSNTPQKPSPSQNRRYVGITMVSLTPDLTKTLKARHPDFPDIEHGVLVYRVVTSSPAYSAGIRPGDVITKINGATVRSSADVYNAVDTSSELQVSVQRGLDTFTLTVAPEAVEQ